MAKLFRRLSRGEPSPLCGSVEVTVGFKKGDFSIDRDSGLPYVRK
jgi:hypothetical protein